MMRLHIYLVACLLVLISMRNQVQATDELGAEIRYDCVDTLPGHFQVEVTRYYACSATPFNPGSPVIDIAGSCGSPAGVGAWQSPQPTDATPICPTVATLCNGLPSPILTGIQSYTYTHVYDFSALSCADAMISFRSCCRPADLQQGAASENLFIQAGPIDPLACNHAPQWIYNQGILLDTITEAHVALGTYDADGDSLAYSLVDCLDSTAKANTYAGTFTGQKPLGSNWTVEIDSITGNLYFIPSPGGPIKSSICIEIREYRAGQLIGTYTRDRLVEATGDIPSQPSATLPHLLSPYPGSVDGGSWRGNRMIEASIGQPVRIRLNVFDSENDETIVSWSRNIPALSLGDSSLDPTLRIDSFSAENPTIEVLFPPKNRGTNFFTIRLQDRYWCGLVNIRDFTFGIDVIDTSFFASFPTDTIFICRGDTIDLKPQLTGSPATTPLLYFWPNPGSSDSMLRVSQPGTYEVSVVDTLGPDVLEREANASVVVAYAPHCVWPGDADNDGVANNFDVLAIGLAYGQTGPVRADQSLSWTGKQAQAWGDTAALGGVDAVFANTNGDGVIDVNDTLAISQNYRQSHLKGDENGNGPPIFLFTSTPVAQVMDTVSVEVILGVDTLPADSVYGIAFSITYDNSLVDSGSARFVVDSTWLGKPNDDLFSMQKDLFPDGQIDIGISRNDHNARTGHGHIARMDIIMVDDIIDKRELTDTLTFRIENIRLINAQGEEIPTDASSKLQIIIKDQSSDGILPDLPPGSIDFYPNPTKNQLNIDVHTTDGVAIYVYSVLGKQIMYYPPFTGKKQINLNSLQAGIYIFQARNAKGQIHKKIILSH